MKCCRYVGILLLSLLLQTHPVMAEGDPAQGEKLFNGYLRCYACHSLEPGITKVGPSLAWLFGRAAGTAEGYDRYSFAIRRSGVVWNANSLNAFLADPQKFIPGNSMAKDDYFVSDKVSSEQNRKDVIAYLEQATTRANH